MKYKKTYSLEIGALAGVALFVLFAASTQQAAAKKKLEQQPYSDEEISYLLTTYYPEKPHSFPDSPVLPQPITKYKRSAPKGNSFLGNTIF